MRTLGVVTDRCAFLWESRQERESSVEVVARAESGVRETHTSLLRLLRRLAPMALLLAVSSAPIVAQTTESSRSVGRACEQWREGRRLCTSMRRDDRLTPTEDQASVRDERIDATVR